MSFIQSNLHPNERLVHRTQLHWIIFANPILLFLLSIIFLATEIPYIGNIFLIVSFFYFLPKLIEYITSEFGVTNKRVLVKIGFIQRHSLEILLVKIEGIAVNQSIAGRIMGYGTIVVNGVGGQREHFTKILSPLKLRHQILEQITNTSKHDQSLAQPVTTPPQPQSDDQLEPQISTNTTSQTKKDHHPHHTQPQKTGNRPKLK